MMSYSVINKCMVPYRRITHYKHVLKRCISFNGSKQNIQGNILCNAYQVDIPEVSLPEYVFSQTELYSDYTAFECPSTHKKFTFSEVRKNSKNLSKILQTKFGLNKGDVVLVYLTNCPEFFIAILGCLEAGIIASTANSLYTAEEVLRQLKDSSAKLVITTCDLHDISLKASAQLTRKLPIICIRTKPEQLLPQGALDFTELINTTLDIPDLKPPNPKDIALLPYSSGTTGLPKGVMLSHSNIVANLVQTTAPDIDYSEKANGCFQEVSPAVLPMFHIYGFTMGLNLMTKGAMSLTIPKFNPTIFTDILKTYPVSLLFAAPPLILFLTHYPDIKSDYLKTLRYTMSAAAPLGASDEEKFIEKTGNHVKILQGYGLTETSPVVSVSIDKCDNKVVKGSIGKVVPNTNVKLVKPGDLNGVPLGPNKQGEILVKGPQVMKGYHNNSEATKETFLHSWFKTGDLGYFNEDGFLFITDRVKELIKVRGFQVAPAELEAILRDHPKIKDAAVIGIPHEINGEVPRAYVVTKEDVSPDDISQFVAGKVAKFKQLEGGIEFVEEVPKSSAGKILRRQLKQKYLDEQQA